KITPVTNLSAHSSLQRVPRSNSVHRQHEHLRHPRTLPRPPGRLLPGRICGTLRLPRCRRPRPCGHHGGASAGGGAPQRGGLRATPRPRVHHQPE
ncbi:unnamed protein product, partial [Ixodes pacificus]